MPVLLKRPSGPRPPRADGDGVPRALSAAASWSWRLVAVAAAFYVVVVEVIGRLTIVVVPFLSAMLLTALLTPLKNLLRRLHLPRLTAALLTMLLALASLGGIGTYVVNRAIAKYPLLVNNLSDLVTKVQHYLITGPLHVDPASVNNIGGRITTYLQSRQSTVASGVISAASTLVDVVTGLILTLFLTFFLLYDGDRIWNWLAAFFPERRGQEVSEAAHEMWRTLKGYVGGTFTVAVFHATVMLVTLTVVGNPLVAPLVLLVFVGSFIPIIGVIVFGGLAVVVTLVTNSVAAGVVVLIVLVVANQVESHLLQPLVVGRYVHLHPIVIAVVLTGGAVLAGLPGAIFGVPIVATFNALFKGVHLAREEQGPEERSILDTAGTASNELWRDNEGGPPVPEIVAAGRTG